MDTRSPNTDYNHNNEIDRQRHLLWVVLSLCVAALTIFVIFSKSNGMTLGELKYELAASNPFWLILSFLAMLGFIFFEGQAINVLVKSLGHKANSKQAFIYGSADAYFSAITPSATGGQPAVIYFMVKYGIPVAHAAAVLVINLVFYTFAVLILGIVAVIAAPDVLGNFGVLSKLLISVGTIIIAIIGISLILLFKKGTLISVIMRKTIDLFNKLHIIRKPEKWHRRIDTLATDYDEARVLMAGKTPVMIKAGIYNLLQRFSQMLVPVFMDFAIKGSTRRPAAIWSTQCYVSLGSCCIPVPGAMGVSDYIMIDGFSGLMAPERVYSLEILSRSVAFYSCVITASIVILFAYIRLKYEEARV